MALGNTCTEICTCIWQGFIHKGIFSDVLSDKMAERDIMRHQGLKYMYMYLSLVFIHKVIFSDVLSDKMAEWGIKPCQIHVQYKVLSIRVLGVSSFPTGEAILSLNTSENIPL